MGQTEVHGYVASAIPGRMRIRVNPEHRRLLPKVRAHLDTQPGVSQVETEATTGSVLVHYNHLTTSHEGVLDMLRVIGILVNGSAGARDTSVPRTVGEFQEDRGMITRVGPIVVDWPRSIGYFGAVGLAVALDVIPPPLGIFVAAVPFFKFFKLPAFSPRTHFVASVLEGAAIPVGGGTDGVIRLAGQTRHREGKSLTVPAKGLSPQSMS